MTWRVLIHSEGSNALEANGCYLRRHHLVGACSVQLCLYSIISQYPSVSKGIQTYPSGRADKVQAARRTEGTKKLSITPYTPLCTQAQTNTHAYIL